VALCVLLLFVYSSFLGFSFFFFFFFQAEDGIRDFHVTGVQTCALPIFVNVDDERRGEVVMVWGEPHPYCVVVLDNDVEVGGWEQVIYRLEQEILVEEPGVVSYAVWHKGRSEERRVGKECGAGGAAEQHE